MLRGLTALMFGYIMRMLEPLDIMRMLEPLDAAEDASDACMSSATPHPADQHSRS